MSSSNKGYILVLNNTPYSNHRTLAMARKAGDRLANSQPKTSDIEIWTARDVNDVLNHISKPGEGLAYKLTQSGIDQLGVEPVEYYE